MVYCGLVLQDCHILPMTSLNASEYTGLNPQELKVGRDGRVENLWKQLFYQHRSVVLLLVILGKCIIHMCTMVLWKGREICKIQTNRNFGRTRLIWFKLRGAVHFGQQRDGSSTFFLGENYLKVFVDLPPENTPHICHRHRRWCLWKKILPFGEISDHTRNCPF